MAERADLSDTAKKKIPRFSVPPALIAEYERLARRCGRTKSELFCEIVQSYKARLAEDKFFRLQAKVSLAARAKGIRTEKDVERLFFEDR